MHQVVPEAFLSDVTETIEYIGWHRKMCGQEQINTLPNLKFRNMC